MKRHAIFPILVLAAVGLFVSLACLSTATTPTAVPPTQPPVQIQPTEPPVQPTEPPVAPATEVPTKKMAPTKAPTDTLEPPPAPAALDYFTEEFLQDPGENWEMFVLGPNHDKTEQLTTKFTDAGLRFEIQANDMYVYNFYNPYTYTDVSVSMQVENKGVNSQNIGLVCRATGDNWYEFSVGSDGMWYLYAHDENGYDTMAQAGAASLKQGHATNVYAMDCVGDEISMYVNGVELPYSPFRLLKYFFEDGQVGFNVSSISSTPVIAEVNWFKVDQP